MTVKGPCRDHWPHFCETISNADCAIESTGLKCPLKCQHCTCHDDPQLCQDATFAKCASITEYEEHCPKTCGICGSGT